MELKDLKSAWNKYSSKDANRHQLGEDAIFDMLKKRAKNMIERIDRNIKLSFGVLVLLAILFMFDDFLLTSSRVESYEITPLWIQLLEGLGILLILLSFIYFWFNYHSAKKDYSQSNDLAKVLKSIIRILYVYRKLFHLAITILLVIVSISFITGLYSGIALKAKETGRDILSLSTLPQMEQTIIFGLLVFLIFLAALFLLFRWGFRRLYGNYILKLEDTLHELDEME